MIALLAMLTFLDPRDPRLNERAVEVQKIADVQTIIDEMVVTAESERTGEKARGLIGLAGPQVGVMQRIILVDVGFTDQSRKYGELKVYINPEIVWRSEEQLVRREGCFSVDSHICGITWRAKSLKLKALDRNGNAVEEEFSGITARIVQHEVDHLDGFRFPDRVGKEGTLHWVEEDELSEYRRKWESWPKKCSWETWIQQKNYCTSS